MIFFVFTFLWSNSNNMTLVFEDYFVLIEFNFIIFFCFPFRDYLKSQVN